MLTAFCKAAINNSILQTDKLSLCHIKPPAKFTKQQSNSYYLNPGLYNSIGSPLYYTDSQTEKSSTEEKSSSIFLLFRKHSSNLNSDHDVTEDFMKICLSYCFLKK